MTEQKHFARLARARTALEGLSVADAFGGFYEGAHPAIIAQAVRARRLPEPPWRFTDDTNMALSVFAVLGQCGEIDQDRLARSFAEHYEAGRGYGMGMHRLLPRLRLGESWRELAPALFRGQGSFGNGGAMRVAPVGGYFADDLAAAAEHARRSAEVTHAHPEAAAGAIAAAVAGGIAWAARREDAPPSRPDLIERVLPYVPPGRVHDGLVRAHDLPPGAPLEEVIASLGNGSHVSAMDTVPFALWCAGERLASYEEAFWLTLSGGGDCDTTCAIVGGIVVLYSGSDGIPAAWRKRREDLPAWAFGG